MIEKFFTEIKKNIGFQISKEKDELLSKDVETLKIAPIIKTKRVINNLANNSIDLDTLSGQSQTEISKNYKPLILKENLSSKEIFDYIINLKQEIRENTENEDFSVSLLFRTQNGHLRLKWLPDKNSWLAIDYIPYKGTSKIGSSDFSKYFFEFDEIESTDSEKVFDKILFEYLNNQNFNIHSEISKDFKFYIYNSLKPFKHYLEMERKLFSLEKFRPKGKYTAEFQENEEGKLEAFLNLRNPPSALREAGNQIALITDNPQLKKIKVFISDYDYENDQIYIEKGERIKDWPKKGTIYMVGDLLNNARKMKSIRFLENYQNESAVKLVDLLFRPDSIPKVNLKELKIKKSELMGIEFNETQIKAIDLALSSEDMCLIHGPPGTGKTTFICEIIYRVLSEGKKVLLIAPTHVAVDNVLKNLRDVPYIYPVRLGKHSRVDPEIKKYLLNSKKKEWKHAFPGLQEIEEIKDDYDPQELKKIQNDFLKSIKKEDDYFINDLIINQSNLVCGTTLGVSRYLKTKSFQTRYDYLIIDESSKESLLNFLVPAIHADKWILVGDHRQLPPYVEDEELKILVKEFLRKTYSKKKKKKRWKEKT